MKLYTLKSLFSKNIVAFSIFAAGILMSSSIILELGLDSLEKIFSILSSLSIAIALTAYFYQKSRDEIDASIDQVSFFRREIIPFYNNLRKKINQKNSGYEFPRIKIDIPSSRFIKENYPSETTNQIYIFRNDRDILDTQIDLFNMLEEFSIKVAMYKTASHPAVSSAKNAFINIIEQNAAALIFWRDANANSAYSETFALYKIWKDSVDRASVEERIKRTLSS
jgi:hypothetical protein